MRKKIFCMILILCCIVSLSACSKKDNHVIVADDEAFDTVLTDELNIAYTPTFLFYEEGKLKFATDGEYEPEKFDQLFTDAYTMSVEELEKTYAGSSEERAYKIEPIGTDIYNKLTTLDGKKLDLSKYKRVIIEVVQTTCPHCQNQMINNNAAIHEKYEDVLFVDYFIYNDAETITTFLVENNLLDADK